MLDLIDAIPEWVNLITVKNITKVAEFTDNISGNIAKYIYNKLNKKHSHMAREFIKLFNGPIQMKNEAKNEFIFGKIYDLAICYSSDNDDPTFVYKYIKAKKKYVFVHQSTKIRESCLRCMRRYDSIVVVNELLKWWMINKCGIDKQKIAVLENYVDVDNILNLSKESVDLNFDGAIVLATCGRLCLTKGYDYVILAAEKLKKSNIKFKWLWIGDGPDRIKMEEMINEKGLKNQVYITGFTSNPYKYTVLCDVYIHPSRAEAYALAILEAISLKKVIISTHTIAAESIFKKYHCGILVDDPLRDIWREIIELINNKEYYYCEKDKVIATNLQRDRWRYATQLNKLLSGVDWL